MYLVYDGNNSIAARARDPRETFCCLLRCPESALPIVFRRGRRVAQSNTRKRVAASMRRIAGVIGVVHDSGRGVRRPSRFDRSPSRDRLCCGSHWSVISRLYATITIIIIDHFIASSLPISIRHGRRVIINHRIRKISLEAKVSITFHASEIIIIIKKTIYVLYDTVLIGIHMSTEYSISFLN